MSALPNFKRATEAASRIDAATPVDGVHLVQASTLRPEPIRWLWPGWLALGKLHVLAGAPGQGKTTLLLAFAATITCGGRWPDGTRAEPGSALIWSGEDDPADTLLPRLLAMGADATKVHFITGTNEDGSVRAFDPARDLVQLSAAAQRIGDVRMLMVDPVVSAVGGADSHKNTEVRRALQPLVDLAGAIDCAVVGVSHFGKGTAGRDPTESL
jgi:putative DNA primase/helicase